MVMIEFQNMMKVVATMFVMAEATEREAEVEGVTWVEVAEDVEVQGFATIVI